MGNHEGVHRGEGPKSKKRQLSYHGCELSTINSRFGARGVARKYDGRGGRGWEVPSAAYWNDKETQNDAVSAGRLYQVYMMDVYLFLFFFSSIILLES